MLMSMLWWLLLWSQTPGHSRYLLSEPPTCDSLTVSVFLHDECVISQFYTIKLNKVYATYRDKKVGFIGYFPSPSVSAHRMDRFSETYNIRFPLIEDYYKERARKYQAKVTPEVFVWDHRKEMLIYKGRIDDSYVRVGKRKLHPQHDDLVNIIDAWIAGKDFPEAVETQAIGCFINFDDVPEKH